MTTIHAQVVGDQVFLPRTELERLVELARKSEAIDVQLLEDDLPTRSLMRLADESGAFDFWKEEGEDIYTVNDGEAV